MSRAQVNKRRGKGAGANAQRQPQPSGEGKGNGVRRTSGTERPQASTNLPADIADPVARVIKTRS